MDTTLFFEDCAWLREWPGTPIGDEERRIISEALGKKRAILLAHHGQLTACETLEEAAILAMFIERAAKLQLMAMSAGTILPVDPALAQEARGYRLKPKAIAATFAYYVLPILECDDKHALCIQRLCRRLHCPAAWRTDFRVFRRQGGSALDAGSVARLMGVGTFLVGLLLGYEQIGPLAPILLVALRLVQAIGLGGEWGGAVLMVAETAPPNRRGLFGSIVQIGNPVGRLIATGVFALATRLPHSEFIGWGWRLPFLASALLVLVGLFIRIQLDETPAFQKLAASKQTIKMLVWEALTTFKRQTLIAIGLKVTEVAWVNILSVFAIAYLTSQLGISKVVLPRGICLSVVLDAADRVRDLADGSDCDRHLHLPGYRVRSARELHAGTFGTNVRYPGISLGFQIGAAFGGGITPLPAAVSTGFFNGTTRPISLFLVLLSLAPPLAILGSREMANKSLSS